MLLTPRQIEKIGRFIIDFKEFMVGRKSRTGPPRVTITELDISNFVVYPSSKAAYIHDTKKD